MLRPRLLSRLFAWFFGYFWRECPGCGQFFGGHECGAGRMPTETLGLFRICCRRCD